MRKLHVNPPIEMENKFSPLTSVPEVHSMHNVHTVVGDGGRIRKRVYPCKKSGKTNVSPTKELKNTKRTKNVHKNAEFKRILPVHSRFSHDSFVTDKSDAKDQSVRCPNTADRKDPRH